MMHAVRAVLRRLRRREHGQSLVEFALLIPVLMIFVVAVIDFGKALFTYQVITNAAREGARRAAVADELASDSVVRAAIVQSLAPVAGADKVTWEAVNADGSCPAPAPTAGYVVVCGTGWSGTPNAQPDAVVRIQMDYAPILLGNFVGWAAGSKTFPLRTRMVYRNE